MAYELPSPQEIGAASWRHDWHPYDDYQVVHATYMTNLMHEGLVDEDRLSFREYREGRRLVQVNVEGRVRCKHGVIIEVDKWLDVRRTRRGYEVMGSSYSYQAWFEGDGREILRYDSAHGMAGLHYHLFDSDGRERIVTISLAQLPTLDGFIRQALWIAANSM